MTASRHLRSVEPYPAEADRRELQRCIASLFEFVDEADYNEIRDGIYAPTLHTRRCAVRALASCHDDVPPHVTMTVLAALTLAVDDETRALHWGDLCQITQELLRITDDPEMVRWHFETDRIGAVAEAAEHVVERLQDDRDLALAVLVPDGPSL